MMNDAKFNLRAWASNSTELQELSAKEGTADTDTTVNLLGLTWNTSTDTIGYTAKQFHLDNQPVTKRSVLQLSSQIYDPPRIPFASNNSGKDIHARLVAIWCQLK